jgi:fucose 4-O-acetylase-like acetyltransferase
MRREYEPWIDWIKTIGLTLIVVGHVADTAVAALLPPIYPKQLGVALFLYAAGYGLALERRAPLRVAIGRLFDIYVFGLAIALILSVIGYLQDGNLLESNYLPFAAGVNIFIDAFPANPTTWFIGMYVHLLVLWALVLRRVEIRGRLLAALLIVELIVRAVLVASGVVFLAYMNIANWITVFALGLRHGQGGSKTWRPVPSVALLIAFLTVWTVFVVPLPRVANFPLMRFTLPSGLDALATSLAVSALYCIVTFAVAGLVRALPAFAPVRFIAKHTVIVFIGHMPVYFALLPVIATVTPDYWLRVALHLAACYLGLLLVSWAAFRVVPRDRLRDAVLVRAAAARQGAGEQEAGEQGARTVSATT